MRIPATLALMAFTSALNACSRPPDQIKPLAAVGQPFAPYDCDQLVAERHAYMARLDEEIEKQRGRVLGDAVLLGGFGLIGLAAGKAAAGSDSEAQIASYRGAIDEIDQESRRKECANPVFFAPEPKHHNNPATQASSPAPA